jgi:hypothetical protein
VAKSGAIYGRAARIFGIIPERGLANNSPACRRSDVALPDHHGTAPSAGSVSLCFRGGLPLDRLEAMRKVAKWRRVRRFRTLRFGLKTSATESLQNKTARYHVSNLLNNSQITASLNFQSPIESKPLTGFAFCRPSRLLNDNHLPASLISASFVDSKQLTGFVLLLEIVTH